MRPPSLAALLALALAGCNTGFAPQYRVKELRVLAVRAHALGSESADVRLGETLALDALFWEPDPAARASIQVTWYGCAPIASELLTPCEDADTLADPSRLAAAAADPGSAVRLLGTCQPSASGDSCGIAVPVPDVQAALDFVLGIAASDPDFQCRVWAEMPVVAVVSTGGRSALALKHVRVVPTDDELRRRGLAPFEVNGNPLPVTVARDPTTAGSCGGGTAIDAAPFPLGTAVLCGTLTGLQTYTVCRSDPPEQQLETYEWQWYVSDGEFPDEGGVGNATGREIDFSRPPGPFRLWAVLRDDRRGVGWLGLSIGAAP